MSVTTRLVAGLDYLTGDNTMPISTWTITFADGITATNHTYSVTTDPSDVSIADHPDEGRIYKVDMCGWAHNPTDAIALRNLHGTPVRESLILKRFAKLARHIDSNTD